MSMQGVNPAADSLRAAFLALARERRVTRIPRIDFRADGQTGRKKRVSRPRAEIGERPAFSAGTANDRFPTVSPPAFDMRWRCGRLRQKPSWLMPSSVLGASD